MRRACIRFKIQQTAAQKGAPLSTEQEIIPDGIYQHYKGPQYRVLEVVRHSETLEELVAYECLYENELGNFWVRPKTMFLENLEDGTPRFKLVQKP